MDTKARNKQLKATLEKAFGRGKVSVRAGRGTAWGWAYVDIAYKPRDNTEWQRLYEHIHQLIAVAKIEVGHFYSDDNCGTKLPNVQITFAH